MSSLHHPPLIPTPDQTPSRRQSKRRMIITQIIFILLPQPRIPLSLLPQSILPFDKKIQRRTRRPTNPKHAQTNSIPRLIRRRLVPQKDIGRHNPPDIAEANLHRGRHAAFIMSRHEIRHPRQNDRLCDESAGHDEEKGKVLYACGKVVLGE
jgi:hypothetical protein